MKKLSNYMVVFFFGLLLTSCGKDDEPTNTVSEPPVVPAPTITGFQPDFGPPGRTVTIAGTNLAPPAGDDPSVKFNNTPAKVLSFSETEIVTSVPAGIPVGSSSGKISVDVGAQGAVSTDEFDVTIPELQVTPQTGVAGDKITITMTNFSFDSEAENNSVLFDGEPGVIESVTANQIEVTVPASVSGLLTINVGEVSVQSADNFTFLPPTITDLSITEGTVGSTVVITGSNFSPDPDLNRVEFANRVEATILSSSETELEVVVPYGATEGFISVYVGAYGNDSPTSFYVEPWRKMQDFPGSERIFPISENIGDKIYVGLGQELLSNNPLNDFWEFDPVNDTWTQLEDFPGAARSGAFSFVINGEIYVGGGNDDSDPSVYNDVYKYSPGMGWTEVASMAYTVIPEDEEMEPFEVELDHSIVGGSGYAIDGIGFVYGGQDPNGQFAYNELWTYDPNADEWSGPPSAPGIAAKIGAIAFEYGDVAYIGLGISNGPIFQSDFRTIDAQGNVATDIGYPGEGSFGCVGVVMGDRAYVGLGQSGIGFNKDIWAFDFATQEWYQKADFPGSAPQGQFSSTANGMLYTGLGSADNGNTLLKDIWEYNPSNDPDPMEEE